MRVPLTYQQKTLLVFFFGLAVFWYMNRYLETRRALREASQSSNMTSSAIRRRLIWRNWVRIHKTVRVTPDGRWPDRQAHEHARRNRGYERTRQQAEGGLMPDIMG